MNRQRSIIIILALLIVSAFGTTGSLLYALEEYDRTVDSYNLIDMKVEKKHYSSIAEYYAYPVYITLENKASMTFGSILPVYIKDRGWVRAQLIKKGDTVIFYQDGQIQFLEITKIRYGEDFHQFYTYVNVADNHNYFRDGVLVHNYDIAPGADAARERAQNAASSGGGDDDSESEAEKEREREREEEKRREEAAVLSSERALADATNRGVGKEELESYERAVNENIKALEIGESQRASERRGDPVLVTTGKFVFEETDIFLKSGLTHINLNRFYMSGNTQVYSMGQGWATMLDSRLIRGFSKDADALAQSLYAKKESLKALQSGLKGHMSYAVAQNAYNTIQNQYNEINKNYLYLIEEATEAASLATLNEYVVTSATPEPHYDIGNGNLTYIDITGSTILFEYSKNGEWKPSDAEKAQYMKIASLDGKDSLSEAGFILYEKGGMETWFDKWGLIEKKVDRSKNETIYVRDAGTKQLQKIESAEGRKIQFTYTANGLLETAETSSGEKVAYRYAGTVLTTVIDTKGNTSLYEYDAQGYLTKFTKPDGAYISFEYGLENADGERLTTSTVNEERYAEYFEYDQNARFTVYTDYSGVKSYIYYDEKHRTTKEVKADGTTTEYFYDDATGNMLTQTINGDRTQYSYDGRGNKIRTRYSDGSTESWIYNNFDQIQSYTNRDGKRQSLQYDAKGNITEINIGGQVLLRASYDSTGKMVNSTDYNNNRTTYVYDIFGNMASRSIGGAIERFEYDGQNRIISYTDAENRRWEYEYTAKTITERAQNGLQTVYTYDSRKDLVQILETDTISGEERITKLEYDARHLMQRVIQDDKVLSSYTYYPAGELRTEIIGEREKEEYWINEYKYDASGKVQIIQVAKWADGRQEGSTYSENYEYVQTIQGQTRTRIAPLDRKQSYGYDRWNRMTALENALGEKSERIVSSAGRAQREQSLHGGWYEYGYDEAGRLSSVAEEGAQAIQVIYNADGTLAQQTDQEGNTTYYTYNEQGLLAQESSAQRSVYYQYDKVGRIIQVIVGTSANTTSAEQYTEYEYSTDGRTIEVIYGGKYTNEWTLNAWGETIQEKDGEENTQVYEYNSQGQLVKVLDAYGVKVEYEYNALGKVQAIIYPDSTKVEYSYNNLGYMQRITDNEGIQWQGYYDDAGRLMQESGRPGIDRQYSYDKLDRIKTVSIAGVLTESYAYTENGIKVTFTDGKGANYTYTKDAFGRIITEKNRLGLNQMYRYDNKGELEEKADFSHSTTKMNYDTANRTQTINYADGSKNILRYNMAGQIIEASGASGTIVYTYDKAGFLESQTDEEGRETSYYTYDNAGRRTKLVSENREISYTYGKNGELLEVGDNIQRLFVSYNYDVMMRETSRTFGNGVEQHTEYDTIGRTTLITEKNSASEILRAEAYLYDAEGRRTHSVNEKGQVTKYFYDAQGRLETVYYPYSEEKANADKQEATKAGLFFSLDKGIAETLYLTSTEHSALRSFLEEVSFGRGSLLTVMQNVWKENYTYDANNNRLTKTTPWGTVKYRYDSENHLVYSGAEQDGTAFIYDANGNLLRKQNAYKTEQYVYNGQNRMAQSVVTDNIENTQTTSYYGYDAFGRRTIVQDEGFATMRTLYDGQSFDIIRENEVFAGGDFTTNYMQNEDIQYSTSEATGERYRFIEEETTEGRYRSIDNYTNERSRFTGTKVTLYAKGESVAVNRSASTGGASGRAYFGTDILGSVRSATTDSATIEERYEYDAFGTPYKGSFSTGLNSGYTGKPYDATTGLYNYGYRDYSPHTARFTTLDPIRDGNNWFSYVVNDPVNYIDLWGLAIIPTTSTAVMQTSTPPGTILAGTGVIGPKEMVHTSSDGSVSMTYTGEGPLSPSILMEDEGCLVQGMSNGISAALDADVSAAKINTQGVSKTGNHYDSEGNMNISAVANANGMTYTGGSSGDMSTIINGFDRAQAEYAVIAQVNATINGKDYTHYMNVQGATWTDPNTGKEYAPVKGTSKNDYINRSNFLINQPNFPPDTILVPIEDVTRVFGLSNKNR